MEIVIDPVVIFEEIMRHISRQDTQGRERDALQRVGSENPWIRPITGIV